MVNIDAGEFRVLGAVYQFAVTNELIALGSGRTPSIQLTEVGSGSSHAAHAGVSGRAANAEVVAAAIEKLLSGLSDEGDRERWRNELKKLPMPSVVPAYFQMESDGRRFLWVLTSPPGSDSTVIEVIDGKTGEQVGRVSFAGQHHLVTVDRNYMVLRTADVSSGEEWLVVYEWTVS